MSFTRSLLDHLQIAIAVVSDDGTIHYDNAAFRRAFGAEAEAWISTAAHTVGGERGWLQGFFVRREQVHSTDVEFAGRIYRIDNVLTGAKELPGIALVFHDVTAERETEQAKSDSTSMIVHDLRGPLSGIQGTLEFILADRSKLDTMQEDLLSGAMQESERMMSLINELLDFSKIQSGNFVVENEPVRVTGMLKRAVRSLQSVASRSGVQLLSASRRDLPILRGSEEKLTQAIINLVSNSLKFTPTQGVISVGAQVIRENGESDSILITVTDTGVGIKPEEIEQVFQKYKQSGAKSLRGGAGTGLGLYIVRQVVEAHGGTVDIASIPGVGTSMLLRLPLRPTA
ncbi:MAG TPA: PAS domain-containing sensor histidine kinase [Thermoanaerobaculia bacterium]|nr:PAS domain-containing sensor histidine kinase [Thermoanaerobaculia bacterium]